MKIIIFGAGINCRKLLELPRKRDVEIVAILDNDSSKTGIKIQNIPIEMPKSLKEYEFDAVIISNGSSTEAFQMTNQLIDLGLSRSQIFNTARLEISHYFETELDTFFDIEKLERIAFTKTPVPIDENRSYVCETEKAYLRRKREGFFERYCQGEGLDIGYGPFPITLDVAGWEYKNGDAQYLEGLADESFDFVYSSHCLEHMVDVRTALKNWFRVVREGGISDNSNT